MKIKQKSTLVKIIQSALLFIIVLVYVDIGDLQEASKECDFPQFIVESTSGDQSLCRETENWIDIHDFNSTIINSRNKISENLS